MSNDVEVNSDGVRLESEDVCFRASSYIRLRKGYLHALVCMTADVNSHPGFVGLFGY